MKNRPGEKLKLMSVDQLLGVPDTEGSTEIEVARIHAFKDHPFKVVDDDKMHELVESIMQNGVLTPVIVRPDAEGNYEMISGHRRLFAVKQIGLDTIPAMVREMDDDSAVLAMVDSNLQREEILPSEKAFAYKMRYEAMKNKISKVGRPKKNSSQVGMNFDDDGSGKKRVWANEQLAEEVGESRNQIHRYLRLTYLIPSLLDMVDNKSLSFATAVEVSYLSEEVQKWIYEYMKENGVCKAFQLYALRDYLKEHEAITQMEMIRILNENLPGNNKGISRNIKLSENKLNEYFPAFFTKTQMENVIYKLLEGWKKENNGGASDEV